MTEQCRQQLQQILLAQSGPGSLPAGDLSPDDFLEFLRKVEQIVLDEKLSPVMACWSSQNAQRLLPAGQRYRELQRDAFCYSVFSEQRREPPDEILFFLESHGLAIVLYGQQVNQANGGTFRCAGSLDPQVVSQCIAAMMPALQVADLPESARLDSARADLGGASSHPAIVQRCRAEWQPLKAAGQSKQSAPAFTSGTYAWGSDPLNADSSQTKLMSVPEPPPQGGTPAQPDPPASAPAAPQAGPGPPALSPFAAAIPRLPDVLRTAGSQPAGPVPLARGADFIWGGVDPAEAAEEAPAQIASPPAGETAAPAAAHPAAPQALPPLAGQEGVPIPLQAQEIIRDIIGQLRHSNDLDSILQLAIERLTATGQAHRGLIWQVVGDSLTVTNEFATNGHTCFVGQPLPHQESMAMVYEFLSRFPDDSGAGVISIADTMQDTKLHKLSPTLASLIELGDVRARLVAQLRCRGQFSGFLELQECGKTRQWTESDSSVLQSVCNMLSVVVGQALDQKKIQTNADKLELINNLTNLFRESGGERINETLVRSLELVAEHLGFVNRQIYLFSPEEQMLVPLVNTGEYERLALADADNPFVAVFESGRDKVINLEYSRRGDPYFEHETAVLVPLVHEGERLGVFGLWQRMPHLPQMSEKDRELATTIGNQLAINVRADQATALLRADKIRSDLINRVSNEIRRSLKEADHILETAVECLREYFGLALCVIAQYDSTAEHFVNSKSVGLLAEGQAEGEANVGEILIAIMLEDLKREQILFLTAPEIAGRLAAAGVSMPANVKAAALVPLFHAGNFKAALCMVYTDRFAVMPEKDMQMVRDVADRVAVVISHAELFVQVERQAITDPMTGLYNRRHFAEKLSAEMDRYKRFGSTFSYIIIDLDFLKKINDNLGHQYGDLAIKHIAAVLKKTTRDVDTTARYGGEEFLILLPETDVKAARIAAERVCVAIREHPAEGFLDKPDELAEKTREALSAGRITEADAERFRQGIITASIGVATCPADTQDREKLGELADQALYLAKHRGRNQVCSVSEDLMPSLNQKGEEALEVQKHVIKKKAEELPIDLDVIAEHGILGLMGTIIKFIEAKDEYSKDRSPKAAEYASKLAQGLRLSKEHVTIISLAAVLNNLGKIALPKEILQKKGPLTPEERKVIEKSPLIAAKILEPAKHLHRVASVVESYHEHWDGSGYPKGMKGEEIPLESRIIALVDAFIAMTSDRPYRKAMSEAEAIAELQKGAGKEWDPRLVKLFLSILTKERKA